MCKSSILYQRIINVHESYDTVCVSYKLYHIVKLYISYNTLTNVLKLDFLLKFVLLFESNKLLDCFKHKIIKLLNLT